MSNTEYLKITPSSEPIHRTDVPATLESLHKLSNPASTSFWNRADPRVDTAPPTFEFLVVSTGPDEPVEFYYGVDQEAHVKTLEKRLTSIFPHSFTITKTELDLEEALVPERDTPQEEHSDLELDEHHPSSEDEPIDDSKGDDEYVEPSPLGVEWVGKTGRKEDWMTTITPFVIEELDEEYDAERPPLSAIVDALHEMTVPIAYQVVWQRKPDWRDDAEIRKSNLRNGRDTWSEELIGSWIEPVDADPEERELSQESQNRIRRIESKHPRRTFTVNVRAVAMGDPDDTDLHAELEQLKSSLDPLEGPFYELVGRRIREKGILSRRKAKRAQRHLERVFNAEIVTGGRKTRPDLVFNADELANLVVVPGGEDLTVDGSRGVRSEQRSRNPLPRPNPDLMEQFREGMAIGYALDENGTPEDEPTRIPPQLLPTHYLRAATTGAGKSKALINDMLSLYESTDGPIILVDPKGDGMTENYLRAHARRFGVDDLEENVLHFSVPDILPGFSFFNLTPGLSHGQRRVDAVQRKADHYEEILKLVMGRDRYERATASPLLIEALIKTLFDEEHGRENGRHRASSDYFAHQQLEHALDQLWQAGPPNPNEEAIPNSSDPEVTRTVRRQLQSDGRTFANVMGGVSNRFAYISQDSHLRRIFNNTDPQFDFRELLDENQIVLFDLGDLRDDAARMLTGVILTSLEDALRTHEDDLGQRSDDYVVNLLIDEAASVVVSDVLNDLLEKGRSFRLSVGLSMQFPEQMQAEGGRRVYLNALNNIGSPILGKVNVDRELARAMAHEDLDPTAFANRVRSLPRGEWIAQLPSPVFGETGPYPFSIKPLPIPPGHPESDDPLSEYEEQQFQRAFAQVHDRTRREFGVHESAAPTAEAPEPLQDVLGADSSDLDHALAHIIRNLQLREDSREDNGWIDAKTVDVELRTAFEEEHANADLPSFEDLADVRQRSRLIEVGLSQASRDVAVRLTDAGESVVALDTGESRAAGSIRHDEAITRIDAALTKIGCTVSVPKQDGSEQPDARAVHPDCDRPFAIEVETTTPDNPAQVLANLRKAQDADELPIFVVEEAKPETYWAERVDGILSSPVRELSTGETRLYTKDRALSFNGGATTDGGVTAVRPATENSKQTVWKRQDGRIVLENGQGDSLVETTSVAELSRDHVPAVYSYDQASGEYIVSEQGLQYVYDSKEAFSEKWTRLMEPFVPEADLSYPDYGPGDYSIVVLRTDGQPVVYTDGETAALETLLEHEDVCSAIKSSDEEESSFEPSELLLAEIADDADAVVGRFASLYLTEESTSTVAASTVYDCYEQWAKQHDIDPDGKSWFARRLGNHIELNRITERRDGELVRCYEGLRLDHQGTLEE
ncbi:conjugal transfer protein [Natronorubrum thiooxidans]|nr:conjugal transfer protein [Natronorubrum thiooxidans]